MSANFGRLNHCVPKNSFSQTAASENAAERLFDGIRGLAPEIVARAAEIEAARRIPVDLVEALRSIGVFRMFVPRSLGGLELDLPTGLEVITALSRIDGSVGWTAMIGSSGNIFAPLLPRKIFERIYEDGPDVIFAGSTQPVGVAEATSRGWRVSGRWPFASGCQHADWIMGFCVMTRHGKPLRGEGGGPLIRGVALRARDWQLEDTWHVTGLKGSGSHHIVLNDVMAPTANFFDLQNGSPCVSGPLYQAVREILPILHGAVDVGIAEGAFDDLLDVAGSGRQQVRAPVPMQDAEIFQFELGRVAADLRAARALEEVQTASHWRHALAGTLRDEALRIESTQAGIWVATTCVRVADACFTLAGGSAVYDRSPLQRRMRDLHTAAQHAVAQQRHYGSAGKAALEQFRSQAEEPRQLAAAE